MSSFSVPYVSGEGGYDTYRIPAAITTPDGTLLAFAEGRVGGSSDTGNIDVVVRRSTDGGRSWGPLILVAAGEGDTRGNPSPVIDPATGRLVLLTCFNGGDAHEDAIMRGEVPPERSRRVFVQTSDDDGLSFSAPRDVTEEAKPTALGWRWYATGPGHAVALRQGRHAGRLVVAANHSASPPADSPDTGEEDRYYGAHALLSDDGGRSWRIGFVDGVYDGVVNANESLAAELPGGRLYFNSRDQHGTAGGNRVDAHSLDGGESLREPYAPQDTLADVPVVQGSVLSVGDVLFFAGPSRPDARAALALWRSDDQGRSFTRVRTLSTRPAAYSDLVLLVNDDEHEETCLGVLYETGEAGPYETIELRRVPLRELRG
ncbi:sialidase family protein [Streptomyces sp. 4N509B]|uniref:sialidase family protein n=1 Tax=Streptomyces sp. 4N509B TaxID=3457413 RepID=UPI003FCF39B0